MDAQAAAEATDFAGQAPVLPNLGKMPDGAAAADADSQTAGQQGYQALEAFTQNRIGPDPADAGLGVEFYRHPVDGQDHIRIRIPGDKLYQPDFIVDDHHKLRFARQWEAYRTQQSQFAGQVMLTGVGWIDEGMREHLAFYGIKTVEGLAAMLDGNLDKVGHGTRALRDRARTEMDARKKAAGYDDLRAEMNSMKQDHEEEMAELRAEREALRQEREALAAEKPAAEKPAAEKPAAEKAAGAKRQPAGAAKQDGA